MWSRRNVMAAAAAPLLGLTGIGAASAGDEGPIVIPMRLSDERFWTEVWINKTGPYRFILDTGSPRYFIAPRIVTQAALTYAQGQNIGGITGVEHAQRNYAASEVVIGGVLRDRNVVFALANPGGDGFVGGMPLGLLLLRPTELDFAEGQIRIYETGKPSLDGYQRLPLIEQLEDVSMMGPMAARFKPEPRLLIDVRLDGQIYHMMLDTGAPGAVTLSAATVARRGLWTKYPKWAETDGRGVIESFRGRNVRLNTLQIGEATMANPVVQLIDPSTTEIAKSHDGLIGLEVLRRMGLFIDAGSNELWMKPNGAMSQPFRYNRSGMVIGVRDHVLRVMRLASDSPASAAGLAVGDAITLPPDVTVRSFRNGLTDAPGRVLQFEAQRDGKTFPVKLILRDLI